METPETTSLDQIAILRGVVRRHKRLMAGIFLVVAVPLLARVYYTRHPMYESTSTVLIEPSTAARIPTLEFPGGSGYGLAMILLNSRSLNEAVAEGLPRESFDELLRNQQYTDYMLLLSNWAKEWLGKPPTVLSPQQRALAELQNARMRYSQIPRSGVVIIRGSASSPRVAMDLVNTTIQVLLTRTRGVDQEGARRARAFLEEQARQMKESVANAEDAVVSFQRQRGRVRLTTETEADLFRLSRAEGSLAEIQARREVLGAQMTRAREALERAKLNEAEAAAEKHARERDEGLVASPTAETLAKLNAFKKAQERLASLEAKLARLRERYTDAHPLVRATQEDLASAQARMTQLARDLPPAPGRDTRTPQAIPSGEAERAGLERQLASLEAEDGALQNSAATQKIQADRLRERLRNLPRDEMEYGNLRQSADFLRNLSTIISEKLMGARMQEQGESSVVRIIDPASFPRSPNESRTTKLILMALAVAGGVAFGTAGAVELWRRPVETESDVKRATGLTVLGSVGVIGSRADNQKRRKAKRSHLPVYILNSSLPGFIDLELYRSIRATVETERLKSDFRSILVTSPGPSEGKSTTVLNLAHVFQEFGRRVLVVEADLRRPRLHRTLALTSKPGLVDFLVGEATFGEICQQLPSKVTVIPGQTTPGDISSMLASPRAKELLEQASAEFDLILIDSPPLLAVPDNLLLVTAVDQVILVAKASATSERDLRRAKRVLQQAGARILGVILNQANPQDVYYYHRRYRKYYKVTSDQPTPEAPSRSGRSWWRRGR